MFFPVNNARLSSLIEYHISIKPSFEPSYRTIGLTFRFFGELFSSKEQGFGNVELKFDKIVKAKN